jgi:hypothetical protein
VLLDIDSLQLQVRDSDSRRLFGEAVNAYRGGALRASIVALWIAVVYDLIAKLRELAANGDAQAAKHVKELDSARERKDISRLQKFESFILQVSNAELQILTSHEFDLLKRLHEDRNLCAHPAFISDGDLFQPSSEAVRAHFVHVATGLLCHAPLQGKSAVESFEKDILSLSFPTKYSEISSYVNSKYLNRSKDVLVKQLIKRTLTAAFSEGGSRFDSIHERLAQLLKVFAESKTQIFEQTVPNLCDPGLGTIDDTHLLKLSIFLYHEPRIWDWLGEQTRIRFKKMLDDSSLEALRTSKAFSAFSIKDLETNLESRVAALDYLDAWNVYDEFPHPRFVDRAIESFGDSGAWRTAEDRARVLFNKYAENLSANQILQILQKSITNDQINCAAGMPSLMEIFLAKTSGHFGETSGKWNEFVETMTKGQADNPNAHYAYPGLRKQIAVLSKTA